MWWQMSDLSKTARLSGFGCGKDADDIHGDTVVAEIVIQMRRNGCMSVQGSINDHEYAKFILATAMDTLSTYHARKRLGDRPIIVPAYDTALVGTDEEKRLIKARDELDNAMVGA
jgi:hypothetical protein